MKPNDTFLETERLILRKFRETDFDDFCDYAMDDEMSRMMGRDLLHSRDDARLTFDWLKDKEERGYVLVLKQTGRVIGNLTVTRVPDFQQPLPQLEGRRGRAMSFSISRHYRRRGLMEEALRAAIAALFREGYDYVECGHFDFNTASAALQKKLGFRHLTTERFTMGGTEYTAEEHILWK